MKVKPGAEVERNVECRMSNVGNEEKEKVERTGLKKVTREAEGMVLLQWQRKWGGSPDRVRYGMNNVLRPALPYVIMAVLLFT